MAANLCIKRLRVTRPRSPLASALTAEVRSDHLTVTRSQSSCDRDPPGSGAGRGGEPLANDAVKPTANLPIWKKELLTGPLRGRRSGVAGVASGCPCRNSHRISMAEPPPDPRGQIRRPARRMDGLRVRCRRCAGLAAGPRRDRRCAVGEEPCHRSGDRSGQHAVHFGQRRDGRPVVRGGNRHRNPGPGSGCSCRGPGPRRERRDQLGRNPPEMPAQRPLWAMTRPVAAAFASAWWSRSV